MKNEYSRIARFVVIFAFLLAGCGNGQIASPTPVSPTSVPPTSTLSATASPTILPTTSTVTLVHAEPFDEVLSTIEASDPKYSTYAPNSAAYAAFPQAVRQLAALNAPENNGASMLAYALTFPRPDSYLAAQGLI